MNRTTTTLLAGLAGALGLLCIQTAAQAPDPVASRLDPYVPKSRVVVMTDIANEPDDQMSMVRFLVYANHYDIEGLVATTSTWMRNKVRPDVIRSLIDAYEKVQPNLERHEAGFPAAGALRKVVASGQDRIRDGGGRNRTRLSAGAELIMSAAERRRSTPALGARLGRVEHAGAGAPHAARDAHRPMQLSRIVSKLRVYAISDQDDAGPWIRREFPSLHYIAMPSTPDGDQYYLATWTGISGDRFYKNAPGADFTTFSDEWVNANIRSKGPLGKLYPMPCCIHEGDTPSFLGLIDNGLASFMSPTYGGWGGPIRLAAVLRRDAADVDAGRRLVSRAGQLEGYGDRERRTEIHVGPGDDLAMAPGFPARLRGADGLDDQGRARGESQSRSRRERPGGKSADRDRCRRRHAGDARRARAPAIPTGTR